MRNSKNACEQVIYAIMSIFLLLFVYILCSKIFGGKVYLLYGNNNKSRIEISELQEIEKDFRVEEDGSFTSVTSDPWFDINEKFGVKTILINID